MKDFEQKREASRAVARAILNTLAEQNMPIGDSIEVCAMTMAGVCAGVIKPLTPKEAIVTFLTIFAASLQSMAESDADKNEGKVSE